MMKQLIMVLAIAAIAGTAKAQNYFTRSGFVGFYSTTSQESVKAENKQVYAVIDPTKKALAFTLLVKGFLFEKELMQQHFNENYAESDKYPKASFNGTMEGNIGTAPGEYPVQVNGQLTFHGVTKPVTMPATVTIQQGKLSAKGNFTVKPEDYNITIPALVREKIAKEIKVQVQADCLPSK
ncbi:YceI family protein [Deminuibacter soli]|uniref:YceI family protein n=1 Tax=Deminuibacter soli TaxID=2291815 RepID=A0A3E1NM86_9BACT|nr:YceI family protein [Deminuibacter soli]RFM29043.1 YceI family protein [Deminuibacter soli]